MHAKTSMKIKWPVDMLELKKNVDPSPSKAGPELLSECPDEPSELLKESKELEELELSEESKDEGGFVDETYPSTAGVCPCTKGVCKTGVCFCIAAEF